MMCFNYMSMVHFVTQVSALSVWSLHVFDPQLPSLAWELSLMIYWGFFFS